MNLEAVRSLINRAADVTFGGSQELSHQSHQTQLVRKLGCPVHLHVPQQRRDESRMFSRSQLEIRPTRFACGDHGVRRAVEPPNSFLRKFVDASRGE